MTCIVGLVDSGKVYIGGDSAGVANYSVVLRNDEKVFKNGEIIFGFTTSFRMGQLLRYKLAIPDHDPRIDDFKYLVTDFMDAVIKCFKDNHFAHESNSVVLGGEFLLGYKGRLYHIQDDFQVSSAIDNYNAVGCGEDYAKGAMKILADVKELTAEEKVTKALEAAAYHSSGVSAPFKIISI